MNAPKWSVLHMEIILLETMSSKEQKGLLFSFLNRMMEPTVWFIYPETKILTEMEDVGEQ